MNFDFPVVLYFQRNDGKMGSVRPVSCHADSNGLRGEFYPTTDGYADLHALKGQGPRWMALGLGDSMKPPRVRKGRPVFPKSRTFIEFGAKVTRANISLPSPNSIAAAEVAMLLCGPTRQHRAKESK